MLQIANYTNVTLKWRRYVTEFTDKHEAVHVLDNGLLKHGI